MDDGDDDQRARLRALGRWGAEWTDLARLVCSEREVEALQIREQLRERGEPAGTRAVAEALGLSLTRTRALLLAGDRKFFDALGS